MTSSPADSSTLVISPSPVAMPTHFEIETGPVIEEIPIYMQEKLGSKCCGCCCDYRRAVIWGNYFFIGMATFLILSRDSVIQVTSETFQDDEFSGVVAAIIYEYYRRRSIPLGVALATAVLSQIGVIMFWGSLVGLHSLALIADFTVFCFLALGLYREMQQKLGEIDQVATSPVLSFVLNGFLTLLFLYPQIGFLLEYKLGIMTRDTYSREDYSCCCSAAKPQHLISQQPEQYPPPQMASARALPSGEESSRNPSMVNAVPLNGI